MLIGHTPLVLKIGMPLRISRQIPCLPCEAIPLGLSIPVRRSKSFFYLCHTHIESLYKAFVGWVLDVSSAPHSLPLWGHTIQCVCACPSGLFSGSVLISFYVFPHFFTSFFSLSAPSHPTVRLRGDRRYAYIPLAGLRGVYIVNLWTPPSTPNRVLSYTVCKTLIVHMD